MAIFNGFLYVYQRVLDVVTGMFLVGDLYTRKGRPTWKLEKNNPT